MMHRLRTGERRSRKSKRVSKRVRVKESERVKERGCKRRESEEKKGGEKSPPAKSPAEHLKEGGEQRARQREQLFPICRGTVGPSGSPWADIRRSIYVPTDGADGRGRQKRRRHTRPELGRYIRLPQYYDLALAPGVPSTTSLGGSFQLFVQLRSLNSVTSTQQLRRVTTTTTPPRDATRQQASSARRAHHRRNLSEALRPMP
eukprot:5534133-Pyramimonas_sp.AAC.1